MHQCTRIIHILIISASLINLQTCTKEVQEEAEYIESSMIGVILNYRSTLRLDPILYSSIITYLKLGETVDVLAQSKNRSWIGDTNNYWYKIKSKSGFSGWTYGTNIKVFAGDDKDDIGDFKIGFWNGEKWKMRKKLAGRWWSVDRFDNFTDQCIELGRNGTYKSYCLDCTPIEGDYKIDFDEFEIIFLRGTYVGDRLKCIIRGGKYFLKKEGKTVYKFKKVKKRIENLMQDKKTNKI